MWYTAGVWRRLACLTLIAVFLPACLPAGTPTAESIPSSQVTSAPTSDPTQTPEPTADETLQADSNTTQLITEAVRTATPTEIKRNSTPTTTRSACAAAGGRVDVVEVSTDLLPDPLQARIYLPACYDEVLNWKYPVLYLLHGKSFDDTQWERLGVPEMADRLIGNREIAPTIVVMPYDRSWLEPERDAFGLAVEQDLIPWVDGHYRTLPERDWRAIGGLSRGGAWAAHLGFAHPELFGSIGLHSGFVFHTDVQEMPGWLDQLPQGMVPRIYMDIADKDRPEISGSATWLEDLLTQYGIPHEWHMFTGEHEEEYWQAHVEDYLRWYAQGWGE